MIHQLAVFSTYDYLWFLANFVTGVDYFVIPYLIWYWTRGLDMRGLQYIAMGFGMFVVSCGAHHWNMLRFMGSHPTDLMTVLTDLNMMLWSTAVAYIFHYAKKSIRRYVQRQFRPL